MTGRSRVAAVVAALFAIQSLPALSEEVLEEIIVTAQKREQSLQDVPSTVSTLSGDRINDYLGSAENVRALAGRIPGLNIESSNGRTLPRFYLRGLGNIDFDVNANQPVSMVFDGIALENNVLRSLPLFDIERVEVLKGPQGSLFGRNTNAGIFKVDSVRPDFETGGYVRFAMGSRDTQVAEVAGSKAINDELAARVSLKYQDRKNWIDNLAAGTSGDDFGGFDEKAYRLQLLYVPSETFSGLLKVHGFHQGGTHPQVFYANAIAAGTEGLRDGFSVETANHDGPAGMDLDHFGGALELEWHHGDATITSITGYDKVENFQFADVDGGLTSFNPADIGALGRQVFFGVATGDGLSDHHQITQELRYALQQEDFFYQVGIYFFDEEIDVINQDFVANFTDIVNQKTRSAAVFGQAEYTLSEQASVTFGLRYTDDEKELVVIPGVGSPSPVGRIAAEDDFLNWDIAFTYDASDTVSWFGRVANGSRGPVTLGRFGFTSSAKTETSTSAEMGVRTTLAGGRGRWNASVYTFENDDQQLTATGGVANVNQLLNADKVTGAGFESEIEYIVTDNLYVTANISYTDTQIEDAGLKDDLCGSSPSCTPLDSIVGGRVGPFGPVTEVSIDGNPLPRTPKWLFNFSFEYTQPLTDGEVYLNMDWNYRDKSNLFLHESVEFVAEERWLAGVRAGYRTESANVDVAVVGRNITDEITVDGALNFLNLSAFVNEPRYWGVELKYNF